MTTRKLYSEELVQLSESLEEMGNLVEASLKNLFFSIENKDMQLAGRIVADDRNVNNLERSIEAQCLMLITTQQPIAQDLRTVSSILKVVTDIERIGDHASDIAELIQQMDHKQLERYSGHLQPMIAASREMVHEAVSAFVARPVRTDFPGCNRIHSLHQLSAPASSPSRTTAGSLTLHPAFFDIVLQS